MTISSSLNAGVAGLSANATRLASISDNIANSSTYGYKRVQTDFQSMVISSRGAQYSAGGVRASAHRQIDLRGPLVATSNATDLAVRGRGMLPVAKRTDLNVGNGETNLLLTTTGSFKTDAEGYLTTGSGLVLLGWPANADGSIPTYSRDTDDGLEPVQINVNQLTGEPTTRMTLGVNLPATETVAGAAGAPQQLAVEYYGNLGTSENINVTFTPTVPATGSSNEWTMTMTDSVDPTVTIGEYVLTFADDRTAGGTLASVTTVSGGAYDATTGKLIVNVDGGPIEIDIGLLGQKDALTQLSDTFAPVNITKDGSPVGNMTSVEVDANGYVHASFDTGVTRTIYQVPLVDLPNPNGMVALDDQTYQPSVDSGSYFLWDASDGPTGDIVAFAREESSTDVATELTSMIQTQRAYSSNAKVIQTVELSFADEMSLPVAIAFCVSDRFMLICLRVCSATIALLLVIMLDMKHVPFALALCAGWGHRASTA
ncbi:flagellar hook-basal body complex protein [Sulfitobacter sp. HNIBRBA3233]|uniref:flagellar hook protein FlgE n=1 Tax=Sulfitobacter marinivivus TaxID=3158558 RepID=UPI0032DF1A4D